MMDISTKRFRIWTDKNGAGTFVRDRNAPYHCHPVAASDVPTVSQMAQMKEADFDRTISNLIYAE